MILHYNASYVGSIPACPGRHIFLFIIASQLNCKFILQKSITNMVIRQKRLMKRKQEKQRASSEPQSIAYETDSRMEINEFTLVSALQKEKEELLQQIATQKQMNEDTKENFREMIQFKDIMVGDLLHKVDILHDKIKADDEHKQATIDKYHQDMQTLQASLDELNASKQKHDDLNGALTARKQEYEQENALFTASEQKCEELTVQLEIRQKKILLLEKQNGDLRVCEDRMNALQKKDKETKQMVKYLLKKCDESKKTNQYLLDQIDVLHGRIRAAESESKSEHQTLSESLSAWQNTNIGKLKDKADSASKPDSEHKEVSEEKPKRKKQVLLETRSANKSMNKSLDATLERWERSSIEKLKTDSNDSNKCEDGLSHSFAVSPSQNSPNEAAKWCKLCINRNLIFVYNRLIKYLSISWPIITTGKSKRIHSMKRKK